ncbi:MAG: dihydroorotate dehydrogenase electron transfer subunit [Gammaproteobacteria bacterium]|nr:dihydroorotate dehydrogenase electron transfer subunit [Gammaproteobacteria bacterium]
MNKSHRDSIFLEEAEILSHQGFAGEQFILRVQAPQCAHTALPGSFVHLQCDPLQPMRRPISIMRTSDSEGWIELLYKRVGSGTQLLSLRKPGETLNLLGPIGQSFKPSAEHTHPLLIGGGVGMPPMIFLADCLRSDRLKQPFVILGSEVPFPFSASPSKIMVPGMPEGVIASMPLLDDWGIPCRLASQQDLPGCYQGYVTDLARLWLVAMEKALRQQVEIFACGPHPMLQAVAQLAAEFDIACQVSLEEFMACAVGGCAGCVVEVSTPQGPVMKRVCVDGPVFDARQVF